MRNADQHGPNALLQRGDGYLDDVVVMNSTDRHTVWYDGVRDLERLQPWIYFQETGESFCSPDTAPRLLVSPYACTQSRLYKSILYGMKWKESVPPHL